MTAQQAELVMTPGASVRRTPSKAFPHPGDEKGEKNKQAKQSHKEHGCFVIPCYFPYSGVDGFLHV